MSVNTCVASVCRSVILSLNDLTGYLPSSLVALPLSYVITGELKMLCFGKCEYRRIQSYLPLLF